MLAGSTGLAVLECETRPLKQPDLEWYFRAAGASAANREAVLELVAAAPEEVQRVLGLAEKEGKIVWRRPRLTLLARRPEVAKSARET